ncbi:MAG: amino acid ABC transporter permease [Propionibacteriaceae bacterium]|jgi:polar amino acid transport system permease protein|nr:amino acid ABC transporter permease [Propionibacteriaceae bacterium]
MLFDFALVFTKIPDILKYLPISLEIAAAATATSLVVGFLVAWVKIRRVKALKPLADLFVSFTRGTPVIVQLYVTFYGIPFLLTYLNDSFGWGLDVNGVPPIVFALVALGLNDAAYSSETIRAAILSVDKGQVEAAHSIGMTPAQTLRRIVVPEALVVAVPNLGNGFINLLKNTSLVFVVGVVDLTAASRLIAGRNFRYFEMYVSLAIIYWVLTLVASRLLLLAERRLRRDDRLLARQSEPGAAPDQIGHAVRADAAVEGGRRPEPVGPRVPGPVRSRRPEPVGPSRPESVPSRRPEPLRPRRPEPAPRQPERQRGVAPEAAAPELQRGVAPDAPAPELQEVRP